jgi:flagellar hook-associated protein 2
MAGMQLTGLASGFDWKSIVDQLMELNRAPITRMQREKSGLSQRTNAFNEIKGLVSSLRSSVSALRSENALLAKTAELADTSSAWSATAQRATPTGQYEFTVTQLATKSKLTGAAGIGAAMNGSELLSSLPVGRTVTGGTITVNGQQITVNTSDSLNTILGNITGATGVAAVYDPVSDTVQLSGGAPITLGASNDTSNLLQVLRLSGNGSPNVSTSGSGLSSVRLSGPIDNANLASAPFAATADTFMVNGAVISYDTAADSIQDVLDRINNSTAGVLANFDLSTNRISLTSKTTGNVGIAVTNDNGGLAQAMGLMTGSSLAAGLDAQFTVNGSGTLSSRSNGLDATAHGISGLTVTATDLGTETVTVKGDTSTAKDALNDFIAKYNNLQASIEKYTKVTSADGKVTSAVLAGNRELADISRTLRQSLFQTGSGINGSVQRLADLGISTSGIENTISLSNSSLLEDKLTNFSNDVTAFLTTASSGFIARLETLLGTSSTDVGAASGKIGIQLTSIEKQNKSLDKQIADVERRLESQRQMLESSFIAMERAQSQFQQQSSYLQRTFASNNK